MASLKIEQVDIYKLYIPLHEPFVISLGKIENAENIIVVIKTNEGISGFGECSPYLSINGESIDTCFVVGQYLAKALKGQDPLDLKDCIKRMDKTIFGNSSIKSAFDMALYDIASQHAGLPLYEFLGGKTDKQLFTDMTVSIGEPEKMAADALKYKEAGFTAIKVKLGQSKEKDVERIRAIRLAIGKDIPLRIDANQGWKVKTAIDILQALEENFGWIGRIVIGLLGVAWSIATFFVVPVIAYENLGPIDAFKRSTSLMKQKWGESLGGNFSFGILQFVGIVVVGIVLYILGSMIHPVAGVLLAVMGALLVFAIISAAQTIFISAVYHNVTGDPVKHFNQNMIDNLFERK